jgi:hypothetical protein
MSDLETMKAMLTRARVVFTEAESANEVALNIESDYSDNQSGGPNRGYIGFSSVLFFDKETQNLKAVGAWE